MKPLSVGNVVSAGMRIYRDNFKNYYRLALIGSLWSWIPIYGWAKFYAMQGLISRLAYEELIEKPENNRDAQRYVNGRMWSFLGAVILVSLRFILAYFVGVIAIVLVVGILTTFVGVALASILGDTFAAIVSVIIVLVPLILFFGYLFRLYASFSVTELSLATENEVNASQAIKRSRELTKGFVKNLMLIFFISSLVSIPLWGLIFTVQILPAFIQNSSWVGNTTLFSIFQYAFYTITAALIVPFWQSIKAVIYYDLRVRREGMGIELRK